MNNQSGANVQPQAREAIKSQLRYQEKAFDTRSYTYAVTVLSQISTAC